jgi:hypothetical protein
MGQLHLTCTQPPTEFLLDSGGAGGELGRRRFAAGGFGFFRGGFLALLGVLLLFRRHHLALGARLLPLRLRQLLHRGCLMTERLK